MPIPQPISGERQSQFVQRCYKAIKNEYKPAQGLGICYSTWREGKK
jgi:hypothetical protein